MRPRWRRFWSARGRSANRVSNRWGLMVESRRRTIRRTDALVGALLLCLASGAALAHPHVWITVRTQIVFSPDGKVASLVHDWVFDEMYSAFATQGLAK